MKAWLRPNLLTKEDKTDFIAVPITSGSVGVEDIITSIKQDGMEVTKETALNVIQRYNGKVIELLQSGHNVNTGLVYLQPTIKGVFYDKTWNPEKHKVSIAVTLGQALRKAIEKISVEILGTQSDIAEILSITDKFTGKTDGSLTKGKVAELKGSNLKVVGDHPSIGIKFRNIDTNTETKVDTADIVTNSPSQLMIMVPTTLEAGQYELSVTTQFMGNKNLLKEPKTITFSLPISIE